MEPYLYKKKCEEIIYHIQSKLGIHLSDELRHDIYTNVLQAVLDEIEKTMQWNENWYDAYLELKKKGFPLKYNEIRIRVAREDEPIHPEQILEWMYMLDEGESIR